MKKVLFVCVENSCRSQLAEAFARIHGQGLLQACSSGSKPSGIVNPKGIAAMSEIGYDMSTHTSKPLSDIPDVEYDYVITMGCGDACPHVRARQRIDWNIPDPKEMGLEDFRRVRDMIEQKVKGLVDEVRASE